MDLNDWIVTADTIKTALQLHKTILIASIQTTSNQGKAALNYYMVSVIIANGFSFVCR
jgi:hypothetical protein